MKARIYTYLYRYAGENTWYDIEMDYTEEEIEQKLRQLRKDYPTMPERLRGPSRCSSSRGNRPPDGDP